MGDGPGSGPAPGGATFDSPVIYATKEAALYAARAWVRKHYKG